jgi:hypothetical protein
VPLINLDAALYDDLVDLADTLGLPVNDLADAYVARGIDDATRRHASFLAEVVDRSRITGWMPDGSARLRD